MKSSHQVGALILRVVLGLTFLIHGIVKFQSGIGNIAGWFDSIGIPGFMAYIVALTEIVGGIALILGLATRLVSAIFVILLAVAAVKVKLTTVGFLSNGQMAGYELDLSMLAIAVYLAICGSYYLSIDSVFKKEQHQS